MQKKVYEIKILGCGGSSGVPSIENSWGSCNEKEIKNQRTRSSAFISIKNHDKTDINNILIDVSPDFRLQAITNKINRIDTILFSHAHADHILGIDDIRSINRLMKQSITAYGEKKTIDDIKRMFYYVFNTDNNVKSLENNSDIINNIFFKPMIIPEYVTYYKNINLKNDVKVIPTKQIHGKIETTGFVIDNKIAYISDFLSLPYETIELYRNLDIIIVSAFSVKKHSAHMQLSEVLDLLLYLNPKQAILTHMGTTMDYTVLQKTLPNNIQAGFDGLTIFQVY